MFGDDHIEIKTFKGLYNFGEKSLPPYGFYIEHDLYFYWTYQCTKYGGNQTRIKAQTVATETRTYIHIHTDTHTKI